MSTGHHAPFDPQPVISPLTRASLIPRQAGAWTLTLSAEQSVLADEGSWPEARLIESLMEDLERLNICEPVVVLLDTGHVAFTLAGGRRRPC